MKHALPLLMLALGTTLGLGCNDGPLQSPTIPPITGLVAVGGPNMPNGTGQVAIEVATDENSAVPGSTVTIINQSREVEQTNYFVEGGAGLVVLFVQGDVGDQIYIRMVNPEEGEIDGEFTVVPPSINDVFHPEAGSGSVIAGQEAAVIGSGFCVEGCNTVFFDGTPVGVPEARPTQLFFAVPAGAALGDHTVTVAVAGTDGGEPNYTSHEFTVTVVP